MTDFCARLNTLPEKLFAKESVLMAMLAVALLLAGTGLARVVQVQENTEEGRRKVRTPQVLSQREADKPDVGEVEVLGM